MPPGDYRAAHLRKPWHHCLNQASEDIPPYAVTRIAGAAEFEHEIRIAVEKPDDTEQKIYMVNGPSTISADGGQGLCSTLTQAGYVLYDESTGDPMPGEVWGAQENSFALGKDKPGFVIIGGKRDVGLSYKAVVAIQLPAGGDCKLGQAKLTTTMCGANDFRVGIGNFISWCGEVDPEPTEALNPFFLSAKNGKKVALVFGTTLDLDEEEQPEVEGWIVIQPDHEDQYHVTALRWDTASGCFQLKKRLEAVQSCEDESDWEDWYCPPVCD